VPSGDSRTDPRAQPSWVERALAPLRATPPRWLLISLIAVVTLTLMMLPFRDRLGVLNVLLLYLLLTFAIALGGGVWPGILAAIFGFVALNFFFIPPYYTFHVAAADHGLALVVYLGVAVVTASLVSRARSRAEEAERESRRMALLAELNAALIGDVTLDAILARIAERVVTVYGARGCRVLVRGDDGELHAGAFYPRQLGPDIDRTGLSLAEWAMANRQPVGRGGRGARIVGRRPRPSGPTGIDASGGDALYIPIATRDRVFGVLEVTGRPGSAAFHAEREQTLTTFVDQAALALERARLSEEASQAAVHAASDDLKSALLAAVSHDLRTPLASIKTAATSLLDESVAWDAGARHELLTAIDEETDRLTLMVSNLLDLSRIEGGALRPRQDWYDVDELLADVVERMAGRTTGHPVAVRIEPRLPSLRFDYVQIAQVLLNLIENAAKYTPPGTPIVVTARRLPDAVEIAVHDDGPGILAEHQSRLFERFYRAPSTIGTPGTGIGLTISKGLVEANGGAIAVESAPGEGTTFRLTLPIPPAAEHAQTDPGAAA
jgi:two-component system sensor histidine kinase KdpD